MQILSAQSNKRLEEDLKSDWVKGYVYGYVNSLYQISAYADYEEGIFFMVTAVYGNLGIEEQKENTSDYRDFLEDIHNKLDQKNNDLYRGYEKALNDIIYNTKNRDNKSEGQKVSLTKYLLAK